MNQFLNDAMIILIFKYTNYFTVHSKQAKFLIHKDKYWFRNFLSNAPKQRRNSLT